jgi:hypothetical protein
MLKRGGPLGLLALMLLPGMVAAQTGAITGRVTVQGTGQPLAGVQVFLPALQRGLLTNQDGQYLISGVAAGQYEVRATVLGYSEGAERVTVRAGETITANFALAQSAIELEVPWW